MTRVNSFLLGHWLEMRARAGASDAIKALMNLARPVATVVRDGQETKVPTSDVRLGETVIVKPGDKVPVDGVVLEGGSQVDELILTGELRRTRRGSQALLATPAAVEMFSERPLADAILKKDGGAGSEIAQDFTNILRQLVVCG